MTKLLFSLGKISDLFEKNKKRINEKINNEDDYYLLNVNSTDYIKSLINEFQIDFPELDFKNISVDSYEKEVAAEKFPEHLSVRAGTSIKKDVVVFYLPYTGDIQYLMYSPDNNIPQLSNEVEIKMESNFLLFEYISFNNNAKEIKTQYNSDVSSWILPYEHLKNECKNYNSNLSASIENLVLKRKQKILSKNNLLSSLGIPLRKNESVSKTFSVPAPKLREKVSIKPVVYDKDFRPEPMLDDASYSLILKIINDVGLNFERMPSVYKNKSENDLRDHILFVLDPNFEYGSASGETFNKKGKTDILLRYDSSVVFVAECKFWGGEKAYFEAINQLLGYLTWRNTKTSLILFVDNKEISNILKTIEEVTPDHANYVSFLGKTSENWFNYKFHIEGDRNREFLLAVQLYHIPKIK